MRICRLEHVYKEYNTGEKVVPLKDISLTINSGDFIIVSGSSGVGKSTLLYSIGTMLKIDNGKYEFDGNNISKLNDTQKTSIRAKKIGFIFQDSSMIQALTVKENLEFTQQISGIKDKERMNELIERLGIKEYANFLPYQLSGGQKRRVMVARALINNPTLILADEPTNDLDEHWSNEVIKILKEYTKNNNAVVLVTHNKLLFGAATKVYKLNNGILEGIQ